LEGGMPVDIEVDQSIKLRRFITWKNDK